MVAEQKYLLAKWNELIRDSGASGDTNAVFDMLMGHYNEPHRVYHGVRHIEHSVIEAEDALQLAEHPNEVRFALWFHDVIYNPKEKNNEDVSAQMAHDYSKSMGFSDEFASRTSKLVLATKHSASPEDIDAMVVVDVDLSILGAPKTVFDEYERGIRAEYSWVLEEDFRKGRLEVLTSFLDRPQIYSTPSFQAKYEEQARTNLNASIRELKAGLEG